GRLLMGRPGTHGTFPGRAPRPCRPREPGHETHRRAVSCAWLRGALSRRAPPHQLERRQDAGTRGTCDEESVSASRVVSNSEVRPRAAFGGRMSAAIPPERAEAPRAKTGEDRSSRSAIAESASYSPPRGCGRAAE